MAEQKICNRCGHECPSDALYCLFCGNRFEVLKECPHCTPKLFYKSNVIYCLKCGEELVVSKTKMNSKPKDITPKKNEKTNKIEIEIDEEKEKQKQAELERKLSTYVEPTHYDDGIFGKLEVAITKQALIDYNEEQKRIKEQEEKLKAEVKQSDQSKTTQTILESEDKNKVKILECNDDFCTIRYVDKETYVSSVNPNSCAYVPGEHSKIVRTAKAKKSLIIGLICCWLPFIGIMLSVNALIKSIKVNKKYVILSCLELLISIAFTIGEIILLKSLVIDKIPSNNVGDENNTIQSTMTNGAFDFGHDYSYSHK